MIKVAIRSNLKSKELLLPEETTLREALEQAEVNYTVGMTMLDGSTLQPGDIDKSFGDFGINDHCTLANVIKADNAVTVSVVGPVAVVASQLTVEQIKQIEKYRPDALVVVDKDENPIFRMNASKNPKGKLDKYGASFGPAPTMDGSATIVIDLPEGKSNTEAATWVAEEFGGPLNFIKKLEENAALQIEDINNEVKEIKELIQVV